MKPPAPADPGGFLVRCVKERLLLWSYHVNMRMQARGLRREDLLEAGDTLEILEAYPDDKYLPSYLCLVGRADSRFHVVLAADVAGDNTRVVTMYRPDPAEWDEQLRKRL